ncbi:MAG: hypothetical protein Q7U71_04605 [bacterium]|nr:hypothetical protein [bacterium]
MSIKQVRQRLNDSNIALLLSLLLKRCLPYISASQTPDGHRASLLQRLLNDFQHRLANIIAPQTLPGLYTGISNAGRSPCFASPAAK